jgi:hypothetical protein
LRAREKGKAFRRPFSLQNRFFFAGKSALKKNRLGVKRKHLRNTKKNTFFYKYENIFLKNQNFSSLPMVSTTRKTKDQSKNMKIEQPREVTVLHRLTNDARA